MRHRPLIAVDWGTTNRRAFRLGPGGGIEARFQDECGTLAVGRGGFPAAVAEVRARLGDHPMLLAGMIGSDRGWQEVPYVDAPAGIEAIAAGARTLEEGRAHIVPGVALRSDARPDVMRGEEVQLLGAVAGGLIAADARACHPGTHAKWALLQGGRIASFRTIMTGELFALLRQHGILAAQLQAKVADGAAFREGACHGLSANDLPAELFTVRARLLTGRLAEADAAAYVSGLLIGSDVRIGLASIGGGGGHLPLIGDPSLTALYAAALAEAGVATRCIDGEEAFVAGARALAELLS